MKPSSYPVLKNRPIDQWKVTELKEELKRRKLTTKGLKEELVRRLDESLRLEMESENQEDESGSDDDSQPKDVSAEATPIANESLNEAPKVDGGVDVVVEDAENQADGKNIEVGDDLEPKGTADEMTPIAIESVSQAPEVDRDADIVVKEAEDQDDCKKAEVNNVPCLAVDDNNGNVPDQSVGEQAGEITHASPAVMNESLADERSVEMSNAASENVSAEAALPVQGSENEQTFNKNLDSRTQLDAEETKPSDEEVSNVMSDLNNQVSEVSPSLGFSVKNDSVSNDSMSVNETNELKDSIIADDVKLEPDVKHEMVQPSSNPIVPDGGNSRPMDVEEPQSKVSVDENNKTVNDEETYKKISSADLGSPEKLNLDRSSGEDSMEEDTLENKQVDSTYISDEAGGRGGSTDITVVKEDTPVDITGDDLSAVKNDAHDEDMVGIAASTEKRKLPDDQEAVASIEPSKRQRRWKTESVKAPEPQSSSPVLSTTPKGMPPALSSKRSFSRSNSNADDDGPKERVVPPPSKPPTDSLRIDNFLRPFTLKAVQELLGKTGTVTNFWMDHIKTHCYVTYSSVEEATETRNAVYNLQWPPNGGRLLVAEFVDAEEVKSHVEGPPQPPPPVAPPAAPAAAPAPAALPQPSPRQMGLRQKQMLQTNLPPPPPLTNPPPVRERLQPPPPPPPPEIVEPPVVTLDDLFRKTKTTPRIYYLPLSEEEVRAKLEAQNKNSKAVA